MRSQEAQTPGARAAIEKERLNVTEDKKVWDVREALPRRKVSDPRAQFMTVHAILGIKG